MPFKPKIFWCTSNVLEEWKGSSECLAYWLHSDDKSSSKELLCFSEKLVSGTAKFFHLSGVDSAENHDRVDDQIIDQGRTNTLTTWYEGSLRGAANEFWDLTLTSYKAMGIFVFARSFNREIEIASEILKFTHQRLKAN